MIGKVTSKKELQGEELEKTLEKLFSQDKFIEMTDSMKKEKDFEIDDLEVEKANSLSGFFGKDKEDLVKIDTTIINLVNGEKTINILYNKLPGVEDHYFGQVLHENDQKTIETYEFGDGDEIKTTTNKTDVDELTFQKEEIEIDNSQKDGITTQSWWTGDGCLPGGYQHCGANCGYGSNLDHGGGDPINETDTCCVAHDRCYSIYGNGDKGCDKELVNCVKGQTTWAAAGIRIYF